MQNWSWSALAALAILTTSSISTPCLAETSTQTRGSKSFLVYADPIAFSPYYGVAVAGGLILTEDLVIEAAHTTGKSCTSEPCQFETALSEARLKWFAGNSFFLNFGLAHEKGVWDHGVAWGHTEESNADFRAEVTTTGAVFALGNMWQLGAFTIGCDWFGLYVPLATTEFDFSEGPGYNQASREDDEKKARGMADQTRVLAARFHLGMAL